MAYIPTEWETGDVITAEKLNKAEQGIAAASSGGTLILSMTWDGSVCTLDGSYDDIVAAKSSMIICQGDYVEEDGTLERYYLTSAYVESDVYYAEFMSFEAGAEAPTLLKFSANSSSGDLTSGQPS